MPNFNLNFALMSAFPKPKVNPDSTAKFTFYDTIEAFDNNVWYHKWDEKNVFKVELKHEQSSIPFAIRIGKGGQIYSIITPIGEIMPPQNPDHAWVDDTLLLTTYQYDLEAPNCRDSNNEIIIGFHPFIHQCGMYPNQDYDFQQGKQFWAPIVAENWDSENNQFSTISLGMISAAPSYNRGDVLMYQNTRDMGNGVLEVTYMAYNYNTSYSDSKTGYKTDFGPWGGTRKSKLPNFITSKPDGSWELTNYNFGSKEGLMELKNTGGWGATTQDPNDKSSYTFAWVFGKGDNSEVFKAYSFGDARRHDFNVQSTIYREKIKPGTLYYNRMYFVLGKLHEVSERCNYYQSKVEFGFIDYEQKDANMIPLYIKKDGAQTILTEEGTHPDLFVYAQPVRNSKPLYLIKDNKTNLFNVTCDPYMLMSKYPIPNDPMGRSGIRPYDGSTQIIKLFGFVIPQEFCDKNLKYERLDDLLTDRTYYPMKGIYDKDIMVRIF